MNEFTFIQSKLDEVKYQIQTSATSTPTGSASPKVGAVAAPTDENLSAEEQKELEKKVTRLFISLKIILKIFFFSFVAVDQPFGYVF